MSKKYMDLSRTTLTSSGQPDFGDPTLTPLNEALVEMVSGGLGDEFYDMYSGTNSEVCTGSNTGCSNTKDCADTSNKGCSNSKTC